MSKTIKIIDLINALANNDKKPYQVKYEGNIYTWNCLNHYVDRKNGTSLFYAVIDYKNFLNDTVEIIEEKEGIDKEENYKLKIELNDLYSLNKKILREIASKHYKFTVPVTRNYVEIIEEQEVIDKLEIDENGFIYTNNGTWKGRKLDVAFAKSINKLAEEVKNIKEK